MVLLLTLIGCNTVVMWYGFHHIISTVWLLNMLCEGRRSDPGLTNLTPYLVHNFCNLSDQKGKEKESQCWQISIQCIFRQDQTCFRILIVLHLLCLFLTRTWGFGSVLKYQFSFEGVLQHESYLAQRLLIFFGQLKNIMSPVPWLVLQWLLVLILLTTFD